MERTNVYSTPILEAVATTGKKKFWQMHVTTDGTNFFTNTESWQETKTGFSQHNCSDPNLIKGVNIGKSNETAPRDQAIFETNSEMAKKKRKDGYYELGGSYVGFTLPMLAYPQADIHRLKFPCVVQPKYDGERCMANGITMWSRGAIAYPDDVVAHLKPTIVTDGYTIDGELILPPPFLRQHTQSAAEKFDPERSPKLLYRVYNGIGPECFLKRYEKIAAIVEKINNPQIVLSPYYIVNDMDELLERFKQFKAEGWEGLIGIQLGVPYVSGRGGGALFKMKDRQDAEFQVIGIKDLDKGNYKGCIKFTCMAPPRIDKEGKHQPGGEFDVLPVGKVEEKLALAARRDTILGTWWTIEFQDYTEKGIPEFGTAICERKPEVSG